MILTLKMFPYGGVHILRTVIFKNYHIVYSLARITKVLIYIIFKNEYKHTSDVQN